MGSGYGHLEIEFENTSLKEVLDWIQENGESYGVINIYRFPPKRPNIYAKSNEGIVRYFDYDLYRRNIFYHNLLPWQYEFIVKKVEFKYNFMNKDFTIFVE